MSDRRTPQARSNIVADTIGRPTVGSAPAWHGSVNGHAVAVVVIAPNGSGKLASNS
jgi:hypothetical protein